MAAGRTARGRAPGSALLPGEDGVLDCGTPPSEQDMREVTDIKRLSAIHF
jgi:hypothetical protein